MGRYRRLLPRKSGLVQGISAYEAGKRRTVARYDAAGMGNDRPQGV